LGERVWCEDEDEGNEFEKSSSVSLHWRKGTMAEDFKGSALSDCICMHWPRYMRDSLILPASARVEPAVFAARARSEPVVVRCQSSNPGVDHSPARSTMVKALLDQFDVAAPASLFLTSTQKKP